MPQVTPHTSHTVRTTLSLSADLIDRSQKWVDSGIIANRNALFVAAIERFLAELEREEIDRQFAAMADDEAYQQMNESLANEFAISDWEALTMTEQVTR